MYGSVFVLWEMGHGPYPSVNLQCGGEITHTYANNYRIQHYNTLHSTNQKLKAFLEEARLIPRIIMIMRNRDKSTI